MLLPLATVCVGGCIVAPMRMEGRSGRHLISCCLTLKVDGLPKTVVVFFPLRDIVLGIVLLAQL